MNLRDLEYLVALAESRHFGQAAERCFVSQPTLSGQLKKLEKELGVTLFERTKRSVEVTPLGEDLVEHARQVLDQVETIRLLAENHRDPLVGPFRLGVISTLSPYLMPLILRPLSESCPQTRLVLSEELTDVLKKRLLNHEIDAALVASEVASPDLEAMPLFDEPFWLIHPSKHLLTGKKEIKQPDLESTDMLLLSEGHCLAEQAMSVCRMQERSQQGEMADLRAASLETLLQMVSAGYGCTLLPALAMKAISMGDCGIVSRKLKLPDTHRRVSLIYRSSFPRKEVITTFARLVTENLPNSVQPLATP